jgi:hypothetical protein
VVLALRRRSTAYRPLRSIAGGGMNDFYAVAKAPDTI